MKVVIGAACWMRKGWVPRSA